MGLGCFFLYLIFGVYLDRETLVVSRVALHQREEGICILSLPTTAVPAETCGIKG